MGFKKVPELYLLAFAFFLNGVWEFIQAPIYVFDQQSSVFNLIGCLLFCSGVDALMILSAYWIMSLVLRDRHWFFGGSVMRAALFVIIALALALVSEYVAIHYRNLWQYSTSMPVVPVLGIGLTPILQWLILPPVVLMLTRKFGSGTILGCS